MKLTAVFTLLLATLISCKDVDRDPQSCGSDFKKVGDRCISKNHIFEEKVKTINKSYYSSRYVNQFVTLGSDGNFKINEKKTLEILNSKNPFKSYFGFIIKMTNLHHAMKSDLAELSKLYNSFYSNNGYVEIDKLTSLIGTVKTLLDPQGDLERIMANASENNEVNEKVEFMEKLNELGSQEESNPAIILTMDSYYKTIGMEISGGYEGIEKFKATLVKNLREQDECKLNLNYCLDELKNNTREYSYDFWLQVIKDIRI